MNQSWTRLLPSFIRSRLEGRQTLQKIISNTGWLFADRALRMGVGLLVSVWVARYLGPTQFGQLNYVIAFVALFATFATLGLDGIVVREVVRNPAAEWEILGSAFMLKLCGGALTAVGAVVFISVLRPGDILSRWLVGIVAAGAVFQAFDVIDFWFQSQVLSKYVVLAKNGAFLLTAVDDRLAFSAPVLLLWVPDVRQQGEIPSVSVRDLRAGAVTTWEHPGLRLLLIVTSAPGTTARASSPTTNPTMIDHSMCSIPISLQPLISVPLLYPAFDRIHQSSEKATHSRVGASCG